jgi:hypothetical protein
MEKPFKQLKGFFIDNQSNRLLKKNQFYQYLEPVFFIGKCFFITFANLEKWGGNYIKFI